MRPCSLSSQRIGPGRSGRCAGDRAPPGRTAGSTVRVASTSAGMPSVMTSQLAGPPSSRGAPARPRGRLQRRSCPCAREVATRRMARRRAPSRRPCARQLRVAAKLRMTSGAPARSSTQRSPRWPPETPKRSIRPGTPGPRSRIVAPPEQATRWRLLPSPHGRRGEVGPPRGARRANTSPAWTPLFARAAAVVTDGGRSLRTPRSSRASTASQPWSPRKARRRGYATA